MFSLLLARAAAGAAENTETSGPASADGPARAGVVSSAFERLGVGGYMDRISPLLTEYGVRALGAIVFLLLALWCARRAGVFVRKSLDKARIEATLAGFLASATRIVILILAVVTCLGIFGVPPTMFATAIGAGGLAVGLALQGSLTNISAGAMLAIFRPFKVGDIVAVCGHTGTIKEIDLFTTRLDTFDNRRIIIPNNQVFGSIIENVTHNDVRRADVDVGVEYSADIDRTREVLEGAARGVPGRAAEPPTVVLGSLGDSSVNWQVRVWAPKGEYLNVRQATVREVKRALEGAGIGIPFPQRVVHVRGAVGGGVERE